MAFDLPSDAGPVRDQATLDAVRRGDYTITWATVTSTFKGPSGTVHTATFRVFADALKLGGVRVNATAEVEQQIADLLGCLLLTPKLADLIFLQRTYTLVPMPRPITLSTKAMVEQSHVIDEAIRKLGVNPDALDGIVSTVGKHWVVDNGLATTSRAMNYGWHFTGVQYGGERWESSVTPPLRVIQGRGTAHDIHHVDYSQNVVLVSRLCLVDGQQMDLAKVLSDPELAGLANHDGVLRVLRQPGVAEASPPVVQPPCIGPNCPSVVKWGEGNPPEERETNWASVLLSGVGLSLVVGGFFAALKYAGRVANR